MSTKKKFLVYLFIYGAIASALFGGVTGKIIVSSPEQNPYVIIAIASVVFFVILIVGIKFIQKKVGYGPNMKQ